jgi:hypothetical protein
MTKRGNQLLWNRMRLTLTPGVNSIDTGLCQPTLAFEHGEPILDGEDPTLEDQDGVASRVQVLPMMPTSSLATLSHTEPYVNATTGTVWVDITNASEGSVVVNILFWDPHLYVSPGDADTYNGYRDQEF